MRSGLCLLLAVLAVQCSYAVLRVILVCGTCSTVQLCYFVGNFGVIFVICVV